MNPQELFHHVEDARAFHFPGGYELELPQVLGVQLTKYMVLELIAAALMLAIFIPLARRAAAGGPPRGILWNLFEVVLVFLRDQVARPAIGQHDADRYLPFVWNLFFFILFCNLLGLIPWAGSPTGAISVTGALALVTFVVVIGTGMIRHGALHFWIGLAPQMELSRALSVVLRVIIMALEVLGLLIRHVVLAVRLLANMFAGHLVLAVVVGFIAMMAPYFMLAWLGVTVASVLGATALSLLELFVAVLQAYIFTFLAALFIGMAVHQH